MVKKIWIVRKPAEFEVKLQIGVDQLRKSGNYIHGYIYRYLDLLHVRVYM